MDGFRAWYVLRRFIQLYVAALRLIVGMFPTACTVIADTSIVARSLSPRRGPKGIQFYRQDYSIVLLFGLTELKAQIAWKENVRLYLVHLNFN